MSKKQSKRDAFYSFEKRMRKMLRIHRAHAHRLGYLGVATSFTIEVVRSNSVLGPARTTRICRHGYGVLFIDPNEFTTRGTQ